jgi:protein-S-isoprenylcysteine O-methyltransferase Ste14
MYLSVLIIYPALPIVLGSYYALIPMALIPVILVLRIRNEEWVLKAGLEGYVEYTKRVKYRLIPFIW